VRRHDDGALALREDRIDPLDAMGSDHAANLLGLQRVHQHEIGEHLEVVAKGVMGGALHQGVVPGQTQHLGKVVEGDPAAPRHQVEGAAAGDRRQRVPYPRRQRPHDPVPQPEEARKEH